MNSDVVTLGNCGCGGACAGHKGFTIDTPVSKGLGAALPVVKAMGHVMGIKGLSAVQPGASAGPYISRVSNLANLTTAMLLQLPPEKREAALTEIGGFNWTNDVLRAVQNNPNKGDVTDGLRSSLALHFLVGIVDAETGKNTLNARAYLGFLRLFKDAQDGKFKVAVAVIPMGLGALGAPPPPARDETAMADDHAWCEANKDKSFPAAELSKCKRCPTPAGAFNSAKNSYNYAEWYGAYLCKKPAPYEEAGRVARGMSANWRPPVANPAASYPAPPDKQAIDFTKWKELCYTGNTLDRAAGVRALFQLVFGRSPNNTEVEYYGAMKWCVRKDGSDAATMRLEMEKVRTAIIEKRATNTTPSADSGVVNAASFTARQTVIEQGVTAVQQAAENAFSFVGKTADFIINSVCGAFKQVFGPVVGGAICEIVTLLINSYASLAQALVVIAQEALGGVLDSLKFMAQGKWQEAMLALLKAVGRMLFMLSAPLSVPLLMGSGLDRAAAFADLKAKADRVTNKNPLFPVTLVLAIVQLVGGPTLPTITGITLSISPMIAVFVAPPLLQNATVKQLSGIANLDTMETALENIIKMFVVIVQGIMNVKDMLGKLKGQMQAVMERRLGKGAAGVVELITNTVRAFEGGFKSVQDAITKFQFQQVTAAAVQLLNTIPLMLAAFVGPEEMAAGAVPSITDWMSANEAAGRTVDQQQAALREASLQFLRKLPFPQAMLVAVDASMEQNDLNERAKMVAQIVGRTYKQSAGGFTNTFIPAFKAELLKVN